MGWCTPPSQETQRHSQTKQILYESSTSVVKSNFFAIKSNLDQVMLHNHDKTVCGMQMLKHSYLAVIFELSV